MIDWGVYQFESSEGGMGFFDFHKARVKGGFHCSVNANAFKENEMPCLFVEHTRLVGVGVFCPGLAFAFYFFFQNASKCIPPVILSSKVYYYLVDKC